MEPEQRPIPEMIEQEPEIDLICAIIWQAIKDANTTIMPKNHSDALHFRQYKDEAILWLSSDSTEVMSFRYYCNLINIDADWVREVCWRKSEKLFRNIPQDGDIGLACEQGVEGIKKAFPKYGYHPRMGTRYGD